MYWETLPNWVWAIFYLFLSTTLGTAIWNVYRKKIVSLSIAVIVITITIPIVGVFNSVGRQKGMNEFEHLISEMKQGAIWTFYIITALLYLLFYWGIFVFEKKTKVSY
ncbi:hypothetical protein D7M11_12675 [Paenibacillus ginsengarvi]|uniref:Uncharacterized protein n=1 Tax=Paenibacillus ginsengarvi TaxID=400777 RepID=A0A3B0CG43_9BACL|nr:hypothetical protein D7M11_12675 [Paenibacillus ginsengarvi]